MPRGGKREGAGRKIGSETKKTREIAERAAAAGITPLEYMLQVMREPMPPELSEAIGTGSISVEIVNALAGWHGMRFEAAKAAAPYIHPRLQTTTVQGEGGGEIKVGVTVSYVAAKC